MREHIEAQDKLLEHRLKLWILYAVAAQIIPLLTIAFFIGGIYQTLTTSVITLQKQ